jgi:YVTN family beta-propeller protein
MTLPHHGHRRRARRSIRSAAVILALLLALPALASARTPRFSTATYSSPLALSRDGRLLWVVNPGNDTVSVISTQRNRVIGTIAVGDEPQGVALDPANRYAYVANAAAGTVTAIRITSANPRRFRARRRATFTTGAEPWNIVSSPDGRRIFVANSGQDTITVIDATRARPRIIGHVNLANSRCNDPDRTRHFQPRGLAVTQDSKRLLVTAFLAFVRAGHRQGDDNGKEGVVCRLNINTKSRRIRSYRPAQRTGLGPQITGFTVDSTGDGQPDATAAFPNQLQSIVIHGSQAYLPNIAASPSGPLRFNVDTQAFVNVLDRVNRGNQVDSSVAKFLNLHLGARDPEPGKKKLFFANAWAIAFASRRAGPAYVVSSGSDLLVKVNVAANGTLSNTVDADTTRYIDLNDPANPATSAENAGKNPQGIVINRGGTRAYVNNFVSRNVSVVDLRGDRVLRTIRTAPLPPAGSPQEVVAAGAEVFFSSRGNFNRPAGATVSTSERLSSEGWQSCSSCHFKGLTDGVIWTFNTGPRKSVPLNATFAPGNPNDQRVLNYSAIFDEVEDFEANIRNVSGPGPLAQPVACNAPAAGQPATGVLDPNHGLLIGDNGDLNTPPCVLNTFAKPNAGRPQHTITLPGSNVAVPALTAMRTWVAAAVRTPSAPLTSARLRGGVPASQVAQGRTLFEQAGCSSCHLGAKWTLSTKDFTSPPAAAEISTETTPPPTPPANPVGAQYLNRFLRDIGSWNLGVPGKGNDLGANIGADEKATSALVNGVAQPAQDGLGLDLNGDRKGNGFNVPSLLGIFAVPPYYHNGACETLECVLGNVKHRTANGALPDRLTDPQQRALVVAFLRSIEAGTPPPR